MNLKKTARVLALASAIAMTAGTSLAYASVDVNGVSNTTGPFSENDNLFDVETNRSVDLENIGSLANTVDYAANSGDNIIDYNTTIDDVRGGNVDLSVRFNNDLNRDGFAVPMNLDNNRVRADFRNGTTGPNSINDNELNVEKDSSIEVSNEASIANDLTLDLNTGVNDVDYNTTVGDVRSGNVDVNANIRNSANRNSSAIMWSSLNDGNGDVRSTFRNNVTGPNSENLNTLNVEDNSSIVATNDAAIANEFDIAANSGSNDVVNNTTVGNVRSGDIAVSITGVNSAN